MRRLLLIALLGGLTGMVRAEKWSLQSSTLTYHVTHKFHKVEGTSHSSRGKGVCDKTGCHFLVAAPVNSFESGDTNRDLHMIETTRGATFPMVKVSVDLPETPTAATFTADLSIEFAGNTVAYKAVPFNVVNPPQPPGGLAPKGIHFKGVIPLSLDDFKIPKPSLLGLAIKTEVPIDVDMSWNKE